jgi:hypothetical protein
MDLIFPSEKVLEKYTKHGLTPVLERIEQTLKPFKVECTVLNESSDKKHQISAIIAHWSLQ